MLGVEDVMRFTTTKNKKWIFAVKNVSSKLWYSNNKKTKLGNIFKTTYTTIILICLFVLFKASQPSESIFTTEKLNYFLECPRCPSGVVAFFLFFPMGE